MYIVNQEIQEIDDHGLVHTYAPANTKKGQE